MPTSVSALSNFGGVLHSCLKYCGSIRNFAVKGSLTASRSKPPSPFTYGTIPSCRPSGVGSAMLLLLVRLFGILFDLTGKVAQHVNHVFVAGLFDRLIDGGLDHGDGDV